MTPDTELFELCKEVYEKTGWRVGLEVVRSDGAIFDDPETELYSNYTPLYTSDYLLDKLPNKTYCGINNVGMGVAWKTGTDFDQIASTPLKALLSLTIALSDAGELNEIGFYDVEPNKSKDK